MHPNAELITRFYTAFDANDPEPMAASYTDDATFTDPAFGTLNAVEVRAMWRMLLGRSTDLHVALSNVQADDSTGSAHWDASYVFSGHPVRNPIDATFTFRDGLILTHVDRFDWPKWAAQALGLPGKLLGRTSFLHKKAQATARGQLDAYLAKHPAG